MFAGTRCGVIAQKTTAGYRYWRLAVTGFTSQFMSLAELQLIASDGVTQLARNTSGATAVSNPVGNSGLQADMLIDGDPTSILVISGYPKSATITVTTPNAITPKYLRMQARNTASDQTPALFSLQASSDGSTWATVLSPPLQSWLDGQVKTFTL